MKLQIQPTTNDDGWKWRIIFDDPIHDPEQRPLQNSTIYPNRDAAITAGRQQIEAMQWETVTTPDLLDRLINGE